MPHTGDPSAERLRQNGYESVGGMGYTKLYMGQSRLSCDIVIIKSLSL